MVPTRQPNSYPAPAGPEELLELLLATRGPRALELLNERWIEFWHLIHPSRLTPLVADIPDSALLPYPGALLLKRLLVGGLQVTPIDPQDLPFVGGTAGTKELMHIAAAIGQTRFAGYPVAALATADQLRDVMGQSTNTLFENSNGLVPYSNLQFGVTALLADDPVQALTFLERARSAGRDARFGFITRDSHFKLALVHQNYGESESARMHLQMGYALPRTQSWTEVWIEQTAELTEGFMRLDNGERSGFPDLPLSEYGEMWPYAFGLAMREAMLFQDTERAERLLATAEHSTLLGKVGDGIAAGAIPLNRAQLALSHGHVGQARQALALAPQALLRTQLLRARIAFLAGDYEVVGAEAAHGMTRSIGFFRHRVEFAAMLAAIRLLHGDDATARDLMLTSVQARMTLPRTLYRSLPHELTSHAREHWGDDPRLASLVPADFDRQSYRPLNAPMSRAIDLSERERETLEQLVAGRSRAQIAEELYVSENTVKTHLSSLYRKIGVNSREAAVMWAVTNHTMSPPQDAS